MIIFDEYEYAKKLLVGKQNVNLRNFCLLAKMWQHDNYSLQEIRLLLVDWAKEKNKYFNEIQYRESIKKAILHTRLFKIRIPQPVEITEYELEKIKSLDNITYEKILFVMLVCAKFFKNIPARKNIKETIYSDGLYNNQKIRDIIRLAEIKMTKVEWNKVKHDLTVKTFIVPTMLSADKFKLGIDNIPSPVAFSVDNFKNIVNYYLRWRGGYDIRTCGCGTLYVHSKNRLRCKECAYKKKREHDLIRYGKKPITETMDSA